MTRWSWRRWLVTSVGFATAASIIGIPTGIIRTDWYTRMTPVLWWNVPIWLLSALLTGLVLATYVERPSGTIQPVSGRLGVGGLLSGFAVGCPICNKLVVAALGVSGALNLWAPIQPILGIASVGLLVYALRIRLRGEKECRLQPTPTPAP